MKRQFVDNLYNGGCNINNAKQRSDFDTFAARLNDVYENDEYQLSWYDQQYEHPRSSRTNTCHKTQHRHCRVADNSGRPGLCSAERSNLFVPWTRTTRLGRRSFFIVSPVVWNSLPLHLRSPSISRSQFRAGFKTHLFRLQPFTDFSSENCWRDWT